MIKSMTGYGKGEYSNDGRTFTVEIKSVNHRYFDINFKLAKNLFEHEENIRKKISSIFNRGKFDIYVKFDNFSNVGKKLQIDDELLKQYFNEFNRVSDKFGIINDIKMSNLIELDLFKNDVKDSDSELIWNELSKALDEAITNYDKMRIFEGEKIAKDIHEKIEVLLNNIEKISNYSNNVVEEYKNKLYDRINSYIEQDKIDNNRLLTEIVIYSDKMTIDEEIIRFTSHLNQLENEIKNDKSSGKKLDFIIQELNRETNTIGSKTNCLEITNLVILNKSIIENIREQIQNIE